MFRNEINFYDAMPDPKIKRSYIFWFHGKAVVKGGWT